MNVLFYLSGKKKNKKGLCPVYCRITIRKERAEFASGIFCSKKDWNNQRFEIKNNPVDSAALVSIMQRLRCLWVEYENKQVPITAEEMKCRYLHGSAKKVTLLTDVCDDVLKALKERIGKPKPVGITQASYNTNVARKVNLIKYLEEKQLITILSFSVDKAFCENYFVWLKEQGFCHNYALKNMQFLDRVIKHALEEGMVNQNPLQKFDFDFDDPEEIICLSEEEVSAIANYTFASSTIQRVADLFLFQCETGLAYIDLMHFSYQEDVKTYKEMPWIVKKRHKTDIQMVVPLSDAAISIIQKYQEVLPRFTNQKYNSYLKEVAAIVGIDKALTTHMGRRTFGQRKVNEGYSYDSVAKMMGHATSKITIKHYAKISHERIYLEMQRVQQLAA